MKQDWEIKKLGEIILENKKSTLKSKGNEVGVYPFFISGMKVKTFNKSIIDGQNIYLPTGGNFYVHFYEGKASYSTDTWSLKTIKNTDIKYLYYFLLLNRDYINEKHFKGATIKHLQKNDFREIKIPLPLLPEQQCIVAILDEALAAIAKAKANAEQNLINATALFESYLQGVFGNKGDGWEEKTLGDVFDIGSSKRIMEKDWTVDGVPFYGGKEIVKLAKFGLVVSNSYISEEKYNEYASKYDMPQQGDILITARGTIGIGYIVKKGDKFYYKDGNIISMRAKMPTNPEFILYALKSNAVNDQLKKLTGATVSHLPIEKAKLLVLTIPSFSTQNTVVEKIQEIETETKKLEAIYKQKINDLEELKKSVLQKAFSGELKTVKEVV